MHQSQVKMCFPKRSARRLTELKNPKFLWSLQNAQRDTNNLAISRNFFGYSKLIFLFFVLYHFMLPANFYYGSEFQHGILWGINFGPAIFFFFWFLFCFVFFKPRGFFWVLIFAPIRSSLLLETRSTPSRLEFSWKGRWIFHTLHPKLLYIYLIGNCLGESNEKNQTFLYRKMHLKLKIPGKFSGF